MSRGRDRRVLKWVVLAILVAVVIMVALNRQWVYDFARGRFYQPAGEMVAIREKLDLTEKGKFLFDASWPKLSESDEFNRVCRTSGQEIAILGCYTGGDIYVYNIVAEELAGIRELTTAHELLHANFARMTGAERAALRPSLETVYAQNEADLKKNIETYTESEQFEELYVRVGTEIKNLPEQLEVHYAEIFENQDKIVEFYESYIGVFLAVEAELRQIASEMEAISGEIETKTAEYERRVEQLNADIVSFNSCAEVAGCFKSQSEFSVRRNNLITEQNTLEAMYGEINELILEYNLRVEKYNENVLRNEKLNQMINSSAKPQAVE